MKPALDVLCSQLHVLDGHMSRPARVGFCELSSAFHDGLVLVVEKVGSLVVLGHKENAACGKDDSDNSFQNVQPGIINTAGYEHSERFTYHRHPGYPAVPSMCKTPHAMRPPKAPDKAEATAPQSIYLASEESHCRHTKEKGNASSKFFALVPVAQEQCHGWEQATFEKAQEDSSGDESTKALYEARTHADDSPAKGDERNYTVELQSLDEYRRGKLAAVSDVM